VADPAAKPTNPAGAATGKTAPASPAQPTPTPAPAAAAKPASGNSLAPKPVPPPAGAKPITSVDDLIERAEDRLIAKGSMVRLSPDNPDVGSTARREELEDSLEACGIKVVWDKTLPKDAIVVQAAKGK
jgi:hypothetical protein